MQETRVRFLGWEDPLEKKKAARSSILAWEIPCTEELDWLQSLGSQVSDMPEQVNHKAPLPFSSSSYSDAMNVRSFVIAPYGSEGPVFCCLFCFIFLVYLSLLFRLNSFYCFILIPLLGYD